MERKVIFYLIIEVLDNWNYLNIKKLDCWESWSEQKKHINVLWTTSFKLKIYFANYSKWKQVIMLGHGLHMIFLMKNHKLKNSVLNSLQKMILTNLKLNLKKHVNKIKKYCQQWNKIRVRKKKNLMIKNSRQKRSIKIKLIKNQFKNLKYLQNWMKFFWCVHNLTKFDSIIT